MKRKYNKTIYKGAKKINSEIRSRCADDPTKEIKETDITGNIAGTIIDTVIEKPIHKASYALTSLTYDKKNDHPLKGSATYTAWYLIIKKIVAVIVSVLLGTTALAFIKMFFENDFLSNIRLIVGMIPIMALIYGIYKAFNWFKSLFK